MDENTIFDKVHDIDLKKTMENSYIDYAMSVIASRALPDAVSYTHLTFFSLSYVFSYILWFARKLSTICR